MKGNLLGVLSVWNKMEEKFMAPLQISFFSGEECKLKSLKPNFWSSECIHYWEKRVCFY